MGLADVWSAARAGRAGLLEEVYVVGCNPTF